MLRVIMSVSAEGAGNYFDVALKKSSDYYAKELGVWGGKGAERLGLKGEVTREDFLALASNKVPGTENLTVRTKDKRTEGYDFCYSVPKSVSVYLALNGDRAVERMINEAFQETMVDVEARMETRVRGADEDGSQRHENRTTGNMV